jgi:hypothetical protein
LLDLTMFMQSVYRNGLRPVLQHCTHVACRGVVALSAGAFRAGSPALGCARIKAVSCRWSCATRPGSRAGGAPLAKYVTRTASIVRVAIAGTATSAVAARTCAARASGRYADATACVVS